MFRGLALDGEGCIKRNSATRTVIFALSLVSINVNLGGFAFNVRIMRELALEALLTVSLLEKEAKNSLRVDSKGDLLDLVDGLEELREFAFARILDSLLVLCGELALVVLLLQELAESIRLRLLPRDRSF